MLYLYFLDYFTWIPHRQRSGRDVFIHEGAVHPNDDLAAHKDVSTIVAVKWCIDLLQSLRFG